MTEPTEPTEPTDTPGAAGGDDEAVRRLLQGLPEVAPPAGFFDDLIRTRRRRARAVAGVGLVAAGIAGAVVVAQATGITGTARPAMDELAERHDVVVAIELSSPDRMPADEMPAPYQAPEELGGLERGMAVRHPDDVVQVVYGDEDHYVSVFEQPGELADDAMDSGLTPLDVEGAEAWQTEDGAVVVRRDDVVYVLMGDMAPMDLDEVVADLPDARPLGLTRRLGDAMDDLVDAFGFS